MHVKLGGTWMSSVAPWGDLSWSTDEHGCKQAALGFYLPRGERHPAIARGATFEVMDASWRTWYGLLGEPDWREGQLTAYGLSREAEAYRCFDSGYNATSNPRTAANQAVADGWQVTVDTSVPNTAYTDVAEEPEPIATLADANSDELAQRWAVRADGVFRFYSDPTTPTLHIRPGVVDLGNDDQNYASAIMVRYRTTTGTYATEPCVDALAADRFGYRPYLHDVTSLGGISLARAQAIGNGILTKGRARLGWTNSIEVTPNDLYTSGGVPADLSMIESGMLARAFGNFDDLAWLGGRTYLDVVIGETNYADKAGVITLAPMGSVAQTLADVVEDVMRAAVAA